MNLTDAKYCVKGHLACPMRSCKYCKAIFKENKCNDARLTNKPQQNNSGATPGQQKGQT